MKHRGKRKRRALLSAESKLLFIIRIGGKNDMHPKTRKILYSLRLRRIFSGVFLKANDRVMKILQMVEPYITYGPGKKTGCFKEPGKYGIVGMEDIVNEVATVGHHFKEVSHFLCPFNTQWARKGIAGKEKAF
ncbi:hypothetical protein U1Q18_006839 [Sarracenia purpurea var. burkii]